MKDDNTKQRQEQLTEMVSAMCCEKLDSEYKDLSVKLIEKMGRKHEVPFKRGRIENWAAGIVYALGQINFLFDDTFSPYLSPDEISDYFNCRKSTASNKAREIRRMFNLKPGDKEFSTEIVSEYDLSGLTGDLTRLKSLSQAERESRMYNTLSMSRKIYKSSGLEKIKNTEFKTLMKNILKSKGKYFTWSQISRVSQALKTARFISPANNFGIMHIMDEDGNIMIPAFTSMKEYNMELDQSNVRPVSWNFDNLLMYLEDDDIHGMIVNPNIDNFYVPREVIFDEGYL